MEVHTIVVQVVLEALEVEDTVMLPVAVLQLRGKVIQVVDQVLLVLKQEQVAAEQVQ